MSPGQGLFGAVLLEYYVQSATPELDVQIEYLTGKRNLKDNS